MNAEKTPDYIPALRYKWLTHLYDATVSLTMPEKQFKIALVKQAGIQPHHKVLDFGCGSLTLTLLAKQNNPDAEFTGIDVDQQMISIAQKKIKQSGLQITIDQYNGSQLPYPDGSFDRVMTSLVLHHLDAQQKAYSLKEIKRVLKPDGELHVADWGKPANVFMRGLFYLVQLLDGFKTTTDHAKGLLPRYMIDAGFKEGKITSRFNTIFGTLQLFKAK